MTITRNHLHELVDTIDISETGRLFRLLLEFIPEDMPMPDEIEAIQAGRDEIARGNFVRFEDVDWN